MNGMKGWQQLLWLSGWHGKKRQGCLLHVFQQIFGKQNNGSGENNSEIEIVEVSLHGFFYMITG